MLLQTQAFCDYYAAVEPLSAEIRFMVLAAQSH